MRRYAYIVKRRGDLMPSEALPSQECNCLALRQAARHVTQFYDQCLAPAGLRTTQLSILAKLKRLGPLTINALAHELVMDRTTLGRTMLPLERDGLIRIEDGSLDRRSRELHLTKAGVERLRAARRLWTEAQMQFEAVFGSARASTLRNELRAVASSELGIVPDVGKRTESGKSARAAHRRT
jgi:DNA-binding MarR family transcriptional regulator